LQFELSFLVGAVLVEFIPLHWNKVYIAKEKNEERNLMIQRLPITRSLIWDPWSEFRAQYFEFHHTIPVLTPFSFIIIIGTVGIVCSCVAMMHYN
jgi:hypothetical protein